jgi:hypothetical protein
MIGIQVSVFNGPADWLATPGGVGPYHYPVDLGTGERHSRLPIAFTRWPNFNWLRGASDPVKAIAPAMLIFPMSQGVLPQFDLQTWATAFGKKASGPTINAQPGTQSFTAFLDAVFPDLPKRTDTTRPYRT